MELKNSKTTYLGKVDGRHKFAVNGHIGAVQMSENGQVWQDIKPQLVRDADGWHIENAPYYAEFKDNGTRLVCPDKNEPSKFLRLPGYSLVTALPKVLTSIPTKIDKQVLPSVVRIPTAWGYFEYGFENEQITFRVYFAKAPPATLFGKDTTKILLNAESAGLDIAKLLGEKIGLGIPRPKLAEASTSKEYPLGWTYKDGQLELLFDLVGKQFPLLLQNTTVQLRVTASADDAHIWGTSIALNDNSVYLAYDDAGIQSGFIFRDTNIGLNATIDSAYIMFRASFNGAGTQTAWFYAEEASEPATFSTHADFDARVMTTAKAIWDVTAWTQNAYYDSPSLVDPIQEAANTVALVDLGVRSVDKTTAAGKRAYSYDGSSTTCEQLNLVWSVAAGGWANIKNMRMGTGTVTATDLAHIRMGTGIIDVADIAKIGGVVV